MFNKTQLKLNSQKYFVEMFCCVDHSVIHGLKVAKAEVGWFVSSMHACIHVCGETT